MRNVKESFLALVDAYSKDDGALDMIERGMLSYKNYVDDVFSMEYQIPILRARLEGSDFRQAVMDLDQKRRRSHESAITCVAILNRLAESVGVTPMYDGSLTDRIEIGDFCMTVVKALFEERPKKQRYTLDDLIEKAKEA